MRSCTGIRRFYGESERARYQRLLSGTRFLLYLRYALVHFMLSTLLAESHIRR